MSEQLTSKLESNRARLEENAALIGQTRRITDLILEDALRMLEISDAAQERKNSKESRRDSTIRPNTPTSVWDFENGSVGTEPDDTKTSDMQACNTADEIK